MHRAFGLTRFNYMVCGSTSFVGRIVEQFEGIFVTSEREQRFGSHHSKSAIGEWTGIVDMRQIVECLQVVIVCSCDRPSQVVKYALCGFVEYGPVKAAYHCVVIFARQIDKTLYGVAGSIVIAIYSLYILVYSLIGPIENVHYLGPSTI